MLPMEWFLTELYFALYMCHCSAVTEPQPFGVAKSLGVTGRKRDMITT